MDREEIISVVVPVYNVKQYLERCFSSIVNQTYRRLEILLVDDGSTDGSGELCDILAAQDPRARVIHKENGGLGSARNAGISSAAGSIFSFVDSDDWIEKEMYGRMLELMHKDNAQIAACGIKKITENGEISYYNDNLEERICYSKEEALRELPRNERISNSMCNKLFSRATIQNLKINENIYYEDNPFTPQCVARADRITYTAEPFYCYFERSGSISRKGFSSREFDRVTADRMRLDYYHTYFPQCEDAAAIAFIGTCLKVYYGSRNSEEAKEKRRELKNTLRETIQNYRNLPYSKKQKAKVRLFMYSPQLYTLTMKMRGK